MQIEAVIFDLDGLMIDSERFTFDVIGKLLAKYGKRTSEDWFEDMIGMDNIECAEFVLQQTNLPLTTEIYLQEKYALLLKFLPEVSKPMPGLLAVIQNLSDAGIKLGVASNSFKAYVRIALESLGLTDSFACVLAADEVENAKPAPDLFLLTAECLGVHPKNCLVLEDSSHGLQAALAAGMACVVIPNPELKAADFSEATFVFDSLVAFNHALPEIMSNGRG